MSFSALLADLDASAFMELADDREAIWQRGPDFTVRLAVMVEAGERIASHRGGLASIESGPTLRFSVAEAKAKAPDGIVPEDGDTVSVNGRVFVLRGDPRLDEEINGRDWLCPATG